MSMERKDSANLSSSSEDAQDQPDQMTEPEQTIDELLFANPALEPTDFEKKQAEDPFLRPIADEQQQFYSDDDTSRAVSNLIIFSLLMFTTPFVVMYLTYQYLFIDYFELGSAEAILYSAFCAIISVLTIVVWFVRTAYKEEVEAKKRLDAALKKTD